MANSAAGCGDAPFGPCEEKQKDEQLRKEHHRHHPHHHYHHHRQHQQQEHHNPKQQGKDESPKKKPIFDKGSVLKGRWKIECLIAEGGFGEIYRAADLLDGHRLVAVKGEALDAQLPLLRMELSVLKNLNEFTTSPHILRFHGCGGNNQGNFIVMDLCGKNMMELKKSTTDDRLTPGTSLRLARQMINSLEHLHEAGWLHRDVKPSNFCLGRENATRKTVFVIDFGLCRNYMNADGDIRPPRSRCGFRGTLRYASTNIHEGKDMGRHDDLWSIFYILLEQICGQLPWRRISDKPKVREMKRNTDYSELLAKCPRSVGNLQEHLFTLDYFKKPDYQGLRTHFKEDLEKLRVSEKDPFDWERPTQPTLAHPDTPCPSMVEGRNSNEQ